MSKEKVVMILALIGAVIVTNAGQYVLQKYDKDSIREDYQAQLDEANLQLDTIGSLASCYTVSEEVSSGDPINADDLEEIPFPESSMNELYITNPANAIGKFYRIDIHPGTPLTEDDLMSETIDDTLREIDISLDSWATGLKVGDYLDVRITYPKGEDYIVLSHKRIYDINGTTVKIKMSEREIHFFGAALIDKFVNASYGATIYGAKYTDPGIQRPAEVYYSVPENILSIIANNPNIVDKVVDSSIPRDILESQMEIKNDTLGSTLGTGRTQYQSKLDQARDYFTQQDKQGSTTGAGDSENTTEDIPMEDSDSTSSTTDKSKNTNSNGNREQ